MNRLFIATMKTIPLHRRYQFISLQLEIQPKQALTTSKAMIMLLTSKTFQFLQ